MINLRDLRVDYDQVCAVHDLSLNVGPGEVFGLIGPNGAGKTTTLRAVAGLLEPTYGDIILNGIDIREHREEAEQIVGFMPDAAPLYDDLLVWEFLDLFAASYNIPRERRPGLVGRPEFCGPVRAVRSTRRPKTAGSTRTAPPRPSR